MDRHRSTRAHRQGYRDSWGGDTDTEDLRRGPVPIYRNPLRRGRYAEKKDDMSSNARPTRASFKSTFRSVAYPSKINPFSDSEEEPLFNCNNRSRADSFSEAEENPRHYRSTSDAKYEPRHYKDDSSERHNASSIPKSRDPGRSTRPTPPADGYTTEEESDKYKSRRSAKTSVPRDGHFGRSSRKHEDDGTYPVPKDSFEDLRGTAKDPPSAASPTASDPLRGVDMNIVAMIFIGVSVTFRVITERHVYAVMERFLQESHKKASRNIGQKRIEEIYDYMQKEKLAKNYSDMNHKRVQEFEKETGLSRFKSRVKVTTD